jgi:hypothetical protein
LNGLTGICGELSRANAIERACTCLRKLRNIALSTAHAGLKLTLARFPRCSAGRIASRIDGVAHLGEEVMRAFESLLEPGSTELPECRCGAEMRLFATKPMEDTDIRIFRCDVCSHEFRLMIWKSS